MPEDHPIGAKFKESVLDFRHKLNFQNTNEGELAAFISYSSAFPDALLSLVDTYETLLSGIPNFLCCALALLERGRKPVGIRLDSGDLAYLSREAKRMFEEVAELLWVPQDWRPLIKNFVVAASNDINEKTLQSLNDQTHGIDIYGIGTNLVPLLAKYEYYL